MKFGSVISFLLRRKPVAKPLCSWSSSVASTASLVFLRHGQSTWNQQNIFIGMTDTPLTQDGEKEARAAGRLLADAGIDYFDTEIGLEWVPVVKDWRLNERSYGALVGRNKKQCVEEYGKDQVKRWRRSWDEPPPAMSTAHTYWPGHELRYKVLGIPHDQIPLSESLKDVTKRTSIFWDEVIVPQIKANKKIMIVGHENNLRSLIKRLDSISESDIINVELPRAIPLLYEIDIKTLKPIKLSGSAQYLSGRYLGDAEQLKVIAERDQKQVYDLSHKETLETSVILVKSTTGPKQQLA